MGFDYLDGKRWNQVTREERFFCQRLYQRVQEETPERFVAFLCNAHGLEVPVDGEWEIDRTSFFEQARPESEFMHIGAG